MTAFPKPCGRLDHHDEHDWTRPAHHEGGYGGPVETTPDRTYHCTGRILIEGGWWLDWNADEAAEDDAREDKQRDDRIEDELDQQIREGLQGWGRTA